jgi:hypothetical protein
MFMVTLTTGITFLHFTCMHFWVREILRKWSASAPTAHEVVRIAESLSNTAPADGVGCIQLAQVQSTAGFL